MTALNERQSEALAELINIAFGLTAANLSEISGHRVRLDPPTISSHPIGGLAERLAVFERESWFPYARFSQDRFGRCVSVCESRRRRETQQYFN